MFALYFTLGTHIQCGNYAAALAQSDELVTLAHEKGAEVWRVAAMLQKEFVLVLTGEASDAVQQITSQLSALRPTGATFWTSLSLSYLAKAYAQIDQFEEAWRCIGEAMTAVETTKERMWEADVHRTAGEIALLLPEPHAAKAEAYFERALAVARQQQAKSWELRAAMSMARLWRDQGKRDEAREVLAPVYGWFTEGFDTLDLKEAKALLDELS
jgi:predicted ATPase